MTSTLVTGATRGLGLETVRRLVAAGHDVWLAGRDVARAEQVAAERGARALQLEVTDDDSVARAAARIRDEAGRLDVLVNNAGIAGDQQAPGAATLADLRRVLATNVVGAAAVLSACTPLLEASDAPVVVNVSSAIGSLTRRAESASGPLLAYPMSKAALNMLTVEYAKAYPRWRVNAVTPGLTATDFAPVAAQGHSVETGAEILVRMATIGPDGPTGTFVSADGPLPW